jgi:hypothetical protein
MKLKPDGTDMLWMGAGAAALLVVAVVLHFSRDPNGAARLKNPTGRSGGKDTIGRGLGILGEPRGNVLQLNL